MQVGPAHAEVGVLGEFYPQIQISRGTSAGALLSFARETDELPFPDARGDSHPQGLRGRLPGVRIDTLQADRAR